MSTLDWTTMAPRPPISERSAQQLRALLKRRRNAKIEEAAALATLEAAALRVHLEEGASLGQIAKLLDVGKPTVRDWVNNARRRGDRVGPDSDDGPTQPSG